MRTFRVKGTVTVRFVSVSYTDTEVDEQVKAKDEKDAEIKVLDRMAEEDDFEQPGFLDTSDVEGEVEITGYKLTVTPAEINTPERAARQAVYEMQTYGVGGLFDTLEEEGGG